MTKPSSWSSKSRDLHRTQNSLRQDLAQSINVVIDITMANQND